MDDIDKEIKEIKEKIKNLTKIEKQLRHEKQVSEWAGKQRDEVMIEIREIVYEKVECIDYVADDLVELGNNIYHYFYDSNGSGYKKEAFAEGSPVSDMIEGINECIENEKLFVEALKEIQKKYLNSKEK